MKEVEDSLAFSGAWPVQWLLDNAPVDGRWCLIHATHMTETETRRMAKSGAVAGLCPITEANLGDGIFPAPAFLAEGGHYGVGSDSNILISVSEELRTLEYSQRLSLRARNVVADPGCSTGEKLFLQAIEGGGRALASRNGVEQGKAPILSLLMCPPFPIFHYPKFLISGYSPAASRSIPCGCAAKTGAGRPAYPSPSNIRPLQQGHGRTPR